MKTAVSPSRYCGVSTIRDISVDSQESPVATEQSCMSSQTLGVMKVNGADRSGTGSSGTSCTAHCVEMFV